MVHAFQLLFKNDCNYPIYFAYFIGAHAILFYFLFSNFYKQAYNKQKVRTKYPFVCVAKSAHQPFLILHLQKDKADKAAAAAAAIANGKKNDDADDTARGPIKAFNGQTSIYKNDTTVTRSRHYVGSAN